MSRRSKRLRSIRTPERRDRIAPSKREPVDEGPTHFQLLRRAEAMGQSVYYDDKQKRLAITGKNNGQVTASALSLLHYQSKITGPQYRAGLKYQFLRRTLFGAATPKIGGLQGVIHEHLSADSAVKDELLPEEVEEREINQRIEYQRGDQALMRILYARRVREMVRRVCVDDMMPQANRPNQLARLREGLQVLADTWRTDR